MMIEIDSVSKIYEDKKAVDNLSFTAKPGEILGFLGPNGAGKSTTMKMITTYLTPSSGNIKVCGIPTQENPIEIRANIGYLPEHNPLYLEMYVKEYLTFVAKINHIPKTLRSQRISEMIELCGLEREQQKKIGALSKGYRQRVGLAQALIHNPKVLILDEPTTGLDPNQIIEIRKVIKEAGKEKTVIFSTHILSEVEAICDQVVIINQGKKVAHDTPQNLQKMLHQQNYVRLEIATDQTLQVQDFIDLPQVVRVEQINPQSIHLYTQNQEDIRKQIFERCVLKSYTLVSLTQHQQNMEDVFRNLTHNNTDNKNIG